MRTIESRIQMLECRVKGRSKFSAACICFPDNEWPAFASEVEREIATKTECPLHGKRVNVRFSRLYLPAWRREAIRRWPSVRSAQFQKAWNASFPPDLWPCTETVLDGRVVLRLKDGSMLQTGLQA
jgi:hypothetical protein